MNTQGKLAVLSRKKTHKCAKDNKNPRRQDYLQCKWKGERG